MVTHGDCFLHHGMLALNGDGEKGEEKPNVYSGARRKTRPKIEVEPMRKTHPKTKEVVRCKKP